jgi:hypothetical protein
MSTHKYVNVTVDILSPSGTINHLSTKLNKQKTVGFIKNGMTVYFNAQHFFLKLKPKERCFFDFLCESMRIDHNSIVIDAILKDKFIAHLAAITAPAEKISSGSLNKYIPKLVNLGLLLETDKKAFYIVNPKYVFTGSNSQRLKCLKNLIEERQIKELSIAPLINMSEDEFKS